MKVSSDAVRRGLRTLIDVLLSAGSSGLAVLVLHLFKVNITPTEFATLLAALTPVLSVIKNSLEDSTGKSFLVDKTRPSPDPVTNTSPPVVEGTDTTATLAGDSPPGPLDSPAASESVVFGEVPPGWLLLAVAPEDVENGDEVVGVTR